LERCVTRDPDRRGEHVRTFAALLIGNRPVESDLTEPLVESRFDADGHAEIPGVNQHLRGEVRQERAALVVTDDSN
jgi:hypothetical protein